jgi:hypothetical protein
MDSKYMKIYSTHLFITEMQIKTTVKFHLTPVRMAISMSIATTNAYKDLEKQGPLYTVGGNTN